MEHEIAYSVIIIITIYYLVPIYISNLNIDLSILDGQFHYAVLQYNMTESVIQWFL